MRNCSLLIAVVMGVLTTPAAAQTGANGTGTAHVTGRGFQQALESPLSATWEHVDLRTIVRRIEATRGPAILLDRRIDPSRERDAIASGESLQDFLQKLAREAGGEVSVVGNTVYIGPPIAAGRLRTLVALRQQELVAEGTGIPRTRRAALSQPETITWNDLEQPARLIHRLCESRDLSVEGVDQIPYDLWGGGTMPLSTTTEALSLLLVQWDLTFEWINQGKGIRLVPIPERVTMARSHQPPRGTKGAAALEQWRRDFPGIEGRVTGGEVLVEGTLEQHEAIEGARRGDLPRVKKPERESPRLKPLQQERYTLRIKETPAGSLLKKLGEPAYGQLTFEYDADALRKAGIDLNQRITLEVRMATIEQLLKAALGPLGLTFELSDRSVRLSPAESGIE